MPLLSPDLYAEFGVPCIKRLGEELGGLHIHCCGRYGHHVSALVEAKLPIKAMEFHYPFTKIEEMMPLVDQGVVLVPYFNDEHGAKDYPDTYTYYQDLLRRTEGSGARFWFALVDSSEEAKAFAAELGTPQDTPREWKDEPLSPEEVEAWLSLFENRDEQ